MSKFFRNRNVFGFTLIELLVVIAIIGILAALATSAYTDSQKKSRDSKRKTDLEALKKALELARADTAGGYSYPNCSPYIADLDTAISGLNTPYYTGSLKITDDDSTFPQTNTYATCFLEGTNVPITNYIATIPLDPKYNRGYGYYTFTVDSSGTLTKCNTASTCNAFRLVACLENTRDPQRDALNPAWQNTNFNTFCPAVATYLKMVSYSIGNE